MLSRGNEGRDIFAGDDDRRMFLNTIGEMAERFEFDIAAYVLMHNHYHLLRFSFSAVSRRISIFRNLIQKNKELGKKLDHVKSKIKI